MKAINWTKIGGLVPAIIQDNRTDKVLMLGYMNEESLKKTLRTKKVWFYSRSKRRLWMKGETSGNILNVVTIRPDCDSDALLIRVIPKGPTCHTGAKSCFSDVLSGLFDIILSRKKTMPENSYTSFLFKKGLNKICAKVKEESGEVIRAAKKETRKRVIEESADVLYHLMVLLAQREVNFAEVEGELERRKS